MQVELLFTIYRHGASGNMKRALFSFYTYIILVAVLVGLTMDWLELMDHTVSQSKHIWFPQEWWKAPSQHAMLAAFGENDRIVVKPNAMKSQLWTIREVDYKGKTFWTVLERKEFPQ